MIAPLLIFGLPGLVATILLMCWGAKSGLFLSFARAVVILLTGIAAFACRGKLGEVLPAQLPGEQAAAVAFVAGGLLLFALLWLIVLRWLAGKGVSCHARLDAVGGALLGLLSGIVVSGWLVFALQPFCWSQFLHAPNALAARFVEPALLATTKLSEGLGIVPPRLSAARRDQADRLCKKGKWEAASRELEAAVRLDPSNTDAWLMAAVVLDKFLDKLDKALPFYEVCMHLRGIDEQTRESLTERFRGGTRRPRPDREDEDETTEADGPAPEVLPRGSRKAPAKAEGATSVAQLAEALAPSHDPADVREQTTTAMSSRLGRIEAALGAIEERPASRPPAPAPAPLPAAALETSSEPARPTTDVETMAEQPVVTTPSVSVPQEEPPPKKGPRLTSVRLIQRFIGKGKRACLSVEVKGKPGEQVRWQLTWLHREGGKVNVPCEARLVESARSYETLRGREAFIARNGRLRLLFVGPDESEYSPGRRPYRDVKECVVELCDAATGELVDVRSNAQFFPYAVARDRRKRIELWEKKKDRLPTRTLDER